MQFPLSKLLDAKEIICIREHQTIQEALDIMIRHDYSQLPVIDKQGHLTGLISEQSIVRKYHFIQASVSLLNLTVDHCQVTATTLPHSEDIFKALELLENV